MDSKHLEAIITYKLAERSLTSNLREPEEDELQMLGKPSHEQWKQIISFAERQEISGLVYDALPTLPPSQRPDRELLMQWTSDIVNIENANRLYRKEMFRMFDTIESHQLTPILLKGVALANLHPNPMHRPTGDVDLFVPIDRQNQFIRCFEAKGATVSTEFDTKHTSLVCQGMNWELHFHSTYFYSRRSDKHFRILEAEDSTPDMLCHESIDNHLVTVFPPMLNIVFLTAHIQHHLIMEEVNMRQVVDWMLALHHERTALGIGEVALTHQLERLNLIRLYRALGHIATTHLGLSANSYACLSKLSKSDKRRGEYLLHIITDGHIPGCRQYEPHLVEDGWLTRIRHYGELVKRCIALRSLCPRESFATPFGFAINAIRRRLSKH